MEVVGRGGGVDQVEIEVLVVFIAEVVFYSQVTSGGVVGLERVEGVDGISAGHLQEPFHSAAAVFRAHSIKAMGQQHHQAVLPEPFGFGGGQVGVEEYLPSIEEVTKLGFPDT